MNIYKIIIKFPNGSYSWNEQLYNSDKKAIKHTRDLEEQIREILDSPENNFNDKVKKILSFIDKEREDKENWLNFFKEDIQNGFIPKCKCGKKATRQTEKGKYAQKNNHRPCNWGYYCDKCWDKGLELEKEAMYEN